MQFINLAKKYQKTLFTNFNFETAQKITLVLGNNGTGKTTLLRIIAGTIQPTEGELKISRESGVGLLFGEEVGLYEKETAMTNIHYFAQLNLLTNEQFKANYAELNKYLFLDELAKQKIEKCSKGQKQRIAIAKTLIHDPEIILLDEPTNGLDVHLQSKLIDLINEKSKAGKKVFFSTHHLSDAQAVLENVESILYIRNEQIEIIQNIDSEKLIAIFDSMKKVGEQ